MSQLQKYLTLSSINQAQRTGIEQTVNTFKRQILDNFSWIGDKKVLLYGDVQSGKTSHVLGIIAQAIDTGIETVLLLTSDNSLLTAQTHARAFKTFPELKVLNSDDYQNFKMLQALDPTQDKPPVIIVLNKNATILRKWREHLTTSNQIAGSALLIIDDEADAGSLNGKVNSGSTSRVSEELSRIRSSATSCIYVQVTGTPQSILLQTEIDGWRPDFAFSFQPGEGYIGGKQLFEKIQGNPYLIAVDDQLENTFFESAISTHLLTSAIMLLDGEQVCNMLVHPSHKQETHSAFIDLARKTIRSLVDNWNTPQVRTKVLENLAQLRTTYNGPHSDDEIIDKAGQILSGDSITYVEVNSSNPATEADWSEGINIIVGGNSLGRGLTITRLQTVYYERESKRPQADTLWQHARMFGYDRVRKLLRVFMPQNIASIFQEVHWGNEAIKNQLEKTHDLENLIVVLGGTVKPTRSTVLNSNYLRMLIGNHNYFDSNPVVPHMQELDALINKISEGDFDLDIEIRSVVSLLRQFDCSLSGTFDMQSFISALEELQSRSPSVRCRLIVRRGRKIAFATGTLLSETDRFLTMAEDKLPVVVLYRVEGKSGWSSDPIWVPNIKLPGNRIYFKTG